MPAPDDRAMTPGAERPGATRSRSSRPAPNLLLVLAAALLVARVATGVFEAGHPPERAALVPWRSIAEGEQRAHSEMRPLLYCFTDEECDGCRQMNREVFADPSAAMTIAHMYVPVRVLDREKEEGRNRPDVAALLARYHVKGFPTLVVVPAGGGEPLTLESYPGRDATIQWLTRSGMRMGMRVGSARFPTAMDSSGTRQP